LNIPTDLAYWLALSDKKWVISPTKVEKVYNEHNSIEPLWNADPEYLRKLGMNESAILGFIKYRNSIVHKADFQKIINSGEKEGIRIIRIVDAEYPQLLKKAADYTHVFQEPPLLLFHKGTLLNFDNCVGIVGTRECSHYGHMMARRLGRAVAKLGYTVVSGLARGVDTEAHCGALEVSQGKTIAVLAWMNYVYPSENKELSKDIAARGALLSERYAPSLNFSKTAPGNFVERNRIISGISRCIIAVESAPEGGTVHQVKIAKAQGRKVFAVKPKRENKRAMEGFKLFMDLEATPIDSIRPVKEFLEKHAPTDKSKEKKIDAFYQNRIGTFAQK
jgi:DNA processing protein